VKTCELERELREAYAALEPCDVEVLAGLGIPL
jgi:hypothetical protein